jgi:hypothetical protein
MMVGQIQMVGPVAASAGQIRMVGPVAASAGQTVRVRSAAVAADRKAMADLVLLGRRLTEHRVEKVVQMLMRQMPASQIQGSVLEHWLDRILVQYLGRMVVQRLT